MNDGELLETYVATRAESAFRELVQRHVDFVYRTALRRCAGDVHLARDITQMVFIALARNATRIRDPHALSSWLFGTTRFATGQILRAERRQRERVAEAMTLTTTGGAPEESKLAGSPLIDGALDSLRDRDRQLVILRFFERASFVEIGSKLKISEDAARMGTERALERLRSWLQRRGVSSSATAIGATLAAEAGFGAPVGLATAIAAGAVGGPGAVIGIGNALGFMSTTKATIACAILALLAVGAAGYERMQFSRTRADLQKSDSDRADLQAALRSSRRELRYLNAFPAQPSSPPPVTPASSPAFVPVAGQTDEERIEQLAAGNPALVQLFINRCAVETFGKYGAFEHERGFSEAQSAEFEKAINDGWDDSYRTQAQRAAQGLKSTDAAAVTLSEESIARRYKNLSNVLGPEGFAAFRKFEETEEQRDAIDQLARQISYTSSPLSPEQRDQVTGVVLTSIDPNAVTTSDEIDWKRVYAAGQSFLSEPQLRIIKLFDQTAEIDTGLRKLLSSDGK